MSAVLEKAPEVQGVQVLGEDNGTRARVLTPEALEFVAGLHRRFNATRMELLRARDARQEWLDADGEPAFLEETAHVREGDWSVAPTPPDLQDRRVEITGPTDAKMVINALNSGASCFMADFEDALSPTWKNVLEGQANLMPTPFAAPSHWTPGGKQYRLNEKTAVLIVRPRGWHLPERHVLVDGEPTSASLFDFGLFFFHNAKELLERGSGPYFYLPKLESHLEARLWNDVFVAAQDALGIPRGTIRATVLIETILAAFEMDEILYELRDHAAALNAGRWDYIFSIIKKFRNRGDFVLPDRVQVTMAVPFMKCYAELLVKTCHRRGAHAMGGMAAFIPSRRDAEVNEQAPWRRCARTSRARRRRASTAPGWRTRTWCPWRRAEFDKVLGERPHQKDVKRDDVNVQPHALLQTGIVGGQITEERRAAERERGAAVHRAVAEGQRRRRHPQPDGRRGHGGDQPRAAVAVDPPPRADPGRRRRGRLLYPRRLHAPARRGDGGAQGRARRRHALPGAGVRAAGRAGAERRVRCVPHPSGVPGAGRRQVRGLRE